MNKLFTWQTLIVSRLILTLTTVDIDLFLFYWRQITWSDDTSAMIHKKLNIKAYTLQSIILSSF